MATTKHKLAILKLIAVIFFITAFIIDVSQFGEDFNNFWKNVEVLKIALIIGIVISIGLLFGLFLFYKKKYIQRIMLTIPIAFILFSLADFSKMFIFHYGLDQEYNYFSAKWDIKNGKVQIIETGLILPLGNDFEEEQKEEEKIINQFGYKTFWAGCTAWPGIDKYNAVMEDYLTKRNGKNWQIKERRMIDSVRNKFK